MSEDLELEKVFEEVLEELNQGYKDEAAILQVEAMITSNDPKEWRRLYLRIRALKIIKERKELKEEKRKREIKHNKEKAIELKRKTIRDILSVRLRILFFTPIVLGLIFLIFYMFDIPEGYFYFLIFIFIVSGIFLKMKN